MRKPTTGEPCAGEPHARFGGRGGQHPNSYRYLVSSSACPPPGVCGTRNDIRNSTSSALTFSACSCWTQCPAPSIRWQPTMRVQADRLHALERAGSLVGAPVAAAGDEHRRHVDRTGRRTVAAPTCRALSCRADTTASRRRNYCAHTPPLYTASSLSGSQRQAAISAADGISCATVSAIVSPRSMM